MKRSTTRYAEMRYAFDFGDDEWKADALRKLVQAVPDRDNLQVYVDIGCGNGGTFYTIYKNMVADGLPVKRAIGYDVARAWEELAHKRPEVEFRQEHYGNQGINADIATLNDVVEHVTHPQQLLAEVAKRCKYVILHIPLDDRLSVLLLNGVNVRLETVGHISLWNTSSALNLLTASGLTPLHCYYTPGFLAPSGRKRLMQWIALPIRGLIYTISPWLASVTVGGVSLAVLCEGSRHE